MIWVISSPAFFIVTASLKAHPTPSVQTHELCTVRGGRRWRGLRARWHDSADAAGADTRWRPVPSMDLAHVRSSWPRARSLPIAQHGGQRWRHDPSCCWVKVTGVTETTHVRGEVACFRKRAASSLEPWLHLQWHPVAGISSPRLLGSAYRLVRISFCFESV
jgi:hypothetical protein